MKIINKNGYFANKILKQYSKENSVLPKSTSDLSQLEEWLILRLLKEDKDIQNELNFIEILLSLYEIYSKPGQEDSMRKFLFEFYKNLKDFLIVGTNGNISVKRGFNKVPLLNAHMDSWMDNPISFLDKIQATEKIMAPGFMIGNDDKVGIAIILYLSKFTDLEFKAIFTHSEEIGSIGIQSISKNYYEDCIMGISLDRRGSNNLISVYRDRQMISIQDISYIESLGFLKETPGIFADTYYISQFIPAFNMSVGYYNEHKKNDYVVISEAMNSLKFLERFLREKHYLKIGMIN